MSTNLSDMKVLVFAVVEEDKKDAFRLLEKLWSIESNREQLLGILRRIDAAGVRLCSQCGAEFSPARTDAKYCSDRCGNRQRVGRFTKKKREGGR